MSNAVLEVKNLHKQYEGKAVVDGISFDICEGDIIGFIGPNGAGKSTSINLISTIVEFDQGNVMYLGRDIRRHEKDYKKALGIVPQDLAIYEDLSAYDNVKFFCSLYSIKGNQLKEKVKQALEFVGLWDRRKELPAKFSGGMKRRLNIACAIAHGPKLLIMDEPTVGIDPQSRNNIMEAVLRLNKEGTTIIYTSHYMEEVETLCNRIVLMDKGVIVEDLDKQVYKRKYAAQGLHSLEEIFLHLTGTDLRDMEV